MPNGLLANKQEKGYKIAKQHQPEVFNDKMKARKIILKKIEFLGSCNGKTWEFP